jgi:hypothetical protein
MSLPLSTSDIEKKSVLGISCGRRPEYRSSKQSLFPADSTLGELANEVHQNASGLLLAAMSLAVPANATTLKRYGSSPIVVAQAMIPRDGMMDAQNPMPMKERYLRRFPQPARVGYLIGMPVLDQRLSATFARWYALLPERQSSSSVTASGGDGSGGQSRCRWKRSV